MIPSDILVDKNPYSGMFDGNNYTISGLYFYDTDRKFAGFFGYAAPGTVIQNTVINT